MTARDLPSPMSDAAESDGGGKRLVVIVFVMFALAGLTYLVPALERVRPWVSGEGVPIVRLFQREERAELPAFEGGHAAESARASKLSPAIEVPSPRPSRGEEGPSANSASLIDASEYEGLTEPIQNVEALDHFYAQLLRSAKGEQGAVTRIAHYGDSSIAADEITFTLRRALQTRFGDSGHGFMLVARGAMHYLHRDIMHRESDGWEVQSVVRRSLKNGMYGYGGVLARAPGGQSSMFGTIDRGKIGTRATSFELYYQRHPSGGELRISVDGGASEALSTRAPQIEDAWHRIDVPDGEHSFSLRTVGSEVRLYGMVLERDAPGVVYDSLGLVGARADRLLDADAAHMARQIAHRSPNMLVLGFGGNESGNEWLDTARYARDLAKVIKHMRAGKPEMSCLIFAPLDQGKRDDRGNVVTLSVLPAIVDAQRRVAKEEGCAFYDTWTAMGGEGSVARWYKQRPRLMTSDFRHATPEGYATIAAMYYKALLKGFADYLARQ